MSSLADQLSPGGGTGIGARLREARKAQRLTLAEVAAAAGLTKGFLSKVERDVATPSVASLLRLCAALQLSAGDLLGGGDDRALVRAEDRPQIDFGGIGMHESLLTPFRERRLQVLHSRIEPGGGSGEETYELPIDVEFVFVVAGELELQTDDTSYRLAAGDALTFPPSSRHSFANPSREREAEVLWVLAPALPINGPPGDAEIDWS